jgi:hypothetical protein
MKSYHRDTYGFPANLLMKAGKITPKYSNHALAQAITKGFELPKEIIWDAEDIVEVHIKGLGVIEKAVIRVPYDRHEDISFVIQPDDFVRTAWLNKNTDKHFTLDKTRYMRP